MESVAKEFSQPSYRAKQLYQWVFNKGARSFDEMTNLPKAFRAALVERYSVGRASLGRVAESIDGTRKLPVRLDDGAVVETVLIPWGRINLLNAFRSGRLRPRL